MKLQRFRLGSTSPFSTQGSSVPQIVHPLPKFIRLHIVGSVWCPFRGTFRTKTDPKTDPKTGPKIKQRTSRPKNLPKENPHFGTQRGTLFFGEPKTEPVPSPTSSRNPEEAQSSETWFCASVQPQKQDRVKLHPCNSAQHLRKQGSRAFCTFSLQQLLLGFLPVRYAFGAITCKVKHKQSTSELCRERQRSRVSERNPNGNLTTTPPYSAKTPTRSDTKCWQAQWISALLRSKPLSGVALSGRQSPSKSLEHPVSNIYYYILYSGMSHMSRLEAQRPTKRLSPPGHKSHHCFLLGV